MAAVQNHPRAAYRSLEDQTPGIKPLYNPEKKIPVFLAYLTHYQIYEVQGKYQFDI